MSTIHASEMPPDGASGPAYSDNQNGDKEDETKDELSTGRGRRQRSFGGPKRAASTTSSSLVTVAPSIGRQGPRFGRGGRTLDMRSSVSPSTHNGGAVDSVPRGAELRHPERDKRLTSVSRHEENRREAHQFNHDDKQLKSSQPTASIIITRLAYKVDDGPIKDLDTTWQFNKREGEPVVVGSQASQKEEEAKEVDVVKLKLTRQQQQENQPSDQLLVDERSQIQISSSIGRSLPTSDKFHERRRRRRRLDSSGSSGSTRIPVGHSSRAQFSDHQDGDHYQIHHQEADDTLSINTTTNKSSSSTSVVGALQRAHSLAASELRNSNRCLPATATTTQTADFLGWRERSSSITSDYCSNSSPSQNSTPILSQKKPQLLHQELQNSSGLVSLDRIGPILESSGSKTGEPLNKQQQQREKRPTRQASTTSTTIYENPAFSADTPLSLPVNNSDPASSSNRVVSPPVGSRPQQMRTMAQVDLVGAASRQLNSKNQQQASKDSERSIYTRQGEPKQKQQHHQHQLAREDRLPKRASQAAEKHFDELQPWKAGSTDKCGKTVTTNTNTANNNNNPNTTTITQEDNSNYTTAPATNDKRWKRQRRREEREEEERNERDELNERNERNEADDDGGDDDRASGDRDLLAGAADSSCSLMNGFMNGLANSDERSAANEGERASCASENSNQNKNNKEPDCATSGGASRATKPPRPPQQRPTQLDGHAPSATALGGFGLVGGGELTSKHVHNWQRTKCNDNDDDGSSYNNNNNKLEHAAASAASRGAKNATNTNTTTTTTTKHSLTADLYADSNHYLESALPFVSTAQPANNNSNGRNYFATNGFNGNIGNSNNNSNNNNKSHCQALSNKNQNNISTANNNNNNITGDNYNYIKPLLTYNHQLTRPARNSFELAQMQAAAQRQQLQEPKPPLGFLDESNSSTSMAHGGEEHIVGGRGDISPDLEADQHLYCAVTTTTNPRRAPQNERQQQVQGLIGADATLANVRGNHNNYSQIEQQAVDQGGLYLNQAQAQHHLQQQQHHNYHYLQHQQQQLQQQQHLPYSIYKSPTSLTLNHSYQTLVEKLNENRHQPEFYLNHQNKHHYSRSPPFYSSNNNASSNNHLLLASNGVGGVGLPSLPTNGNCVTSSPVFSSLNTTTSAATTVTPPRSNRDPFLSVRRNHHHPNHHGPLMTSSSLPKPPLPPSMPNFAQKCLGKRADFHLGGRSSRRLKWASLLPFCRHKHTAGWLVQLLVLLLFSLLVLLGLFIVPPWTPKTTTTKGPNSDGASSSGGSLGQQHQTPPSGFGLGPGSMSVGGLIPGGSLVPIGRLPQTNYGPIFQQQQQQQQNVIKQQQLQQQQQRQHQIGDPMKWPPSMTNVVVLDSPSATTATTTATTTTTGYGPALFTTSQRLEEEEAAASTQSYWLDKSNDDDDDDDEPETLANFCGLHSSPAGSSSVALDECSGNGKCNSANGMCSCLLGFSGPTCAIANCPNECNRRGQCKLRQDWPLNRLEEHQLDSIGFQSAGSARWRLSACAEPQLVASSGANQTQFTPFTTRPLLGGDHHRWHSHHQHSQQQLYDNRLQWYCECQPEFTGADCSLERELNCQDQTDNDQDGLADCEDDDCCAQPICRDNLMCYKPPEPSRVLSELQARTAADTGELLADIGLSHRTGQKWRFFAQWQFLIAPNSVQSYAQRRAFDRSRVAVVRGRVVAGLVNVNGHSGGDRGTSSSVTPTFGIVSVRVSVMENAAFGFTLTRQDGHFDLLVNGNEWLTLQFHRNAYTPIKRRIFVRQQAINALEENVLMILSARDNSDHASSDTELADKQQRLLQASSLSPPSPPPAPFGLGLLFDLSQLLEQQQQQRPMKHHSNNNNQDPDQDHEQRRAQLLECLLERAHRSIRGAAPNDLAMSSQLEPMVLLQDQAQRKPKQQQREGEGQQPRHSLRSFALVSASSVAFSTGLRGDPDSTSSSASTTNSSSSSAGQLLEILYNSATFPSSASIAKPTVALQLLPDDFQSQQQQQHNNRLGGYKLVAVSLQLDIEGQTRRERLEPINGLSYLFAWNRRNVYEQKVYGFGELRIRVDYEFRLTGAGSQQERAQTEQSMAACFGSGGGYPGTGSSDTDAPVQSNEMLASLLSIVEQNLRHKRVTFGGRLFMEAHQLNQHADIGRWSLASSARYDAERELLYFGSGWMLPYNLVYPPVVTQPSAILTESTRQQQQPSSKSQSSSSLLTSSTSRLLAKGPNSSLFVALVDETESEPSRSSRLVQLDSTGRKRLLDVPLSILTSKFQSGPSGRASISGFSTVTNNDHQPLTTNPIETVGDLELVYNNFESSLYISSRFAAKIVRISLASLNILNKTLSSSTATLDADEEIDVEPLCGFGRLNLITTPLTSSSSSSSGTNTQDNKQDSNKASAAARVRPCKSVRLSGPHSMVLDEQGQLLYFVDGHNTLLALNLNTNSVSSLLASITTSTDKQTMMATNGEVNYAPDKSEGRRQSSPNESENNNNYNNRNDCLGPGSKLTPAASLALLARHRVHSLAWSRIDSSLYLVIDNNAIVALRPDSCLEIVALGTGSGQAWPPVVPGSYQQQRATSSAAEFDLRSQPPLVPPSLTTTIGQTVSHQSIDLNNQPLHEPSIQQQQQQRQQQHSSRSLPFCRFTTSGGGGNSNHSDQQLGAIREILIDDGSNGHELLVLHQWHGAANWPTGPSLPAAASSSSDTKRAGHFYLAKIALGMRTGDRGDNSRLARLGASRAKRVFDLHSARSTWDPMIRAIAKSAQKQKQGPKKSSPAASTTSDEDDDSIDWLKLSERSTTTDKTTMGHDGELDDNPEPGRWFTATKSNENRSRRIPFIHLLMDGFERVDSLQINSDGTIFLLNLIDQSLRTISAYSPEQFNQVERNDLTLDRLFATPTTTTTLQTAPSKEGLHQAWNGGGGGTASTSTGPNQQQQLQKQPFSLITLRNPIRPSELFEFHSGSGLLLSLTIDQLPPQDTDSTRLDYSYRILANNVNRHHHQHHQAQQQHDEQQQTSSANSQVNSLRNSNGQADEQTASSSLALTLSNQQRSMDEDDENDLEIHKLIFDYMSQFNSNKTGQLLAATNGYMRLGNIVDLKHNNEFALIRQYSNSRFVLQSIQLNQRPICTLTTDHLGVLTTFIQRPNTRTSWVELVYDPMTYLLRNVITKTGTTTTRATSQQQPTAFYQPQTSVMLQTTFPYDDKLIRSTKRIIYDEIFNHYCDLFIVDA